MSTENDSLNWFKEYIFPLITFTLGFVSTLLTQSIQRRMNLKDKKSDWVKQHVIEQIISFVDEQLILMQDIYCKYSESNCSKNGGEFIDELKNCHFEWIEQMDAWRAKADSIEARIRVFNDNSLLDLFNKYTDVFADFRSCIFENDEKKELNIKKKELYTIKKDSINLATEIYKRFFKNQ